MRVLTGKWFLQRRKYFGGFKVIVETIQTTTCPFDFSQSPEFTIFEEATTQDLIALNIKLI